MWEQAMQMTGEEHSRLSTEQTGSPEREGACMFRYSMQARMSGEEEGQSQKENMEPCVVEEGSESVATPVKLT